MNTETIAQITETFVITGRGARIKHIAVDGTVLCPRTNATQEAKNRFEKLPVCEACAEALEGLKAQAVDAALEAAADERATVELVEDVEGETDAELADETGEDGEDEVEIHFSHRVTRFMAKGLAEAHPALARDLNAARLVRNGRGYTAFTVTTRRRAAVLVIALEALLADLLSGAREKGLKGGMNFQPEAVAKGLEHIAADLDGELAA